jgi:hypothetical protein
MSTPDKRTDRLAALSSDKKALLEKWSKGTQKSIVTQIIPQRRETGPAPLSFVQEWYLTHPCNEPVAMVLEGPLEEALLEMSINEIVRRHEILRTTFKNIDGVPMQVIAPNVSLQVPPIESLEALPASERLAHGLQLGMEDALRLTFDLEHGPTWCIRLLRLSPEQHLCVVVFAAILVDGRSQINFFLELVQIYEAFAEGVASPLPDLSLQFADFATWQRQRLQGAVLEDYIGYWRPLLADTPRLQVPTDVPRSPAIDYQRELVNLEIPASQAQEVHAFCRAENYTAFIYFFTLFQLSLRHFTGQRDMFIGVEVTSRQLREMAGLIGAFTHTLPIRMSIVDELNFKELARQGQRTVLDVYAHHDVPAGELVRLCDPERDLFKTPLFNVKAAYFTDVARPSYEKKTRLSLSPQTLNGIENPPEDLKIQIFDFQRGLSMHLEYNSNLFSRSTISNFMDGYHTLLIAAMAAPDQSVSELLRNLHSQE